MFSWEDVSPRQEIGRGMCLLVLLLISMLSAVLHWSLLVGGEATRREKLLRVPSVAIHAELMELFVCMKAESPLSWPQTRTQELAEKQKCIPSRCWTPDICYKECVFSWGHRSIQIQESSFIFTWVLHSPQPWPIPPPLVALKTLQTNILQHYIYLSLCFFILYFSQDVASHYDFSSCRKSKSK